MSQSRKRKHLLLMYGTVFLMVLVPYLFWRGVWFGSPLTDNEIEGILHDATKPRRIQHALVQISDRMSRGESVQRWYPEIERLSEGSVPEVRALAAWLMGQDNQCSSFHLKLASLVKDADPLVRRNSALALVCFGDSQGKPEILDMLRPYPLTAPQDGRISFQLREGEKVNTGTLVARIQTWPDKTLEVHSPMPGFFSAASIHNRNQVISGELIASISPSDSQVWEALRALFVVGEPKDLSEIERFAGMIPQMSERVRQQAVLTAKIIKGRSKFPDTPIQSQ